MRIGRYVVAPLMLVATLAWCAAAGAVIVVGKSIAGVSLDMKPAQVMKILGPGQPVRGAPMAYRYRDGTYLVQFLRPGGGASIIQTTDPHQQTANGVHVGSTLAYVRAHVPQVHCSRGGSPPRVGCYVGSGRFTGLNTTFGFGADDRLNVIAIRNVIG